LPRLASHPNLQIAEVVVYWTRTERKLWFDTVAGGVRVLGATRVQDLAAGALELTVYCRPDAANEFAITSVVNFPQAREAPYRFTIEKAPTKEVPGGAPKLRACRR
jgi:hypothetical protein